MTKVSNACYQFLKILLTLLMAILIVPVTLQIISRYTGLIPRYIWTEELARFCFIWIIMIGAMIAMRDNDHFTVDLLPVPKSNSSKAIAAMFVDFMSFVLAAVLVIWGWPLVKFGLLQSSEMAELPMVFIYVAWPLTGLVWILFLLERTVDNVRLFRS